ncbi:ADP-ribosylation factor family-domain-containing protein [Pavlovales sp. CCMP2436]|nr:ADP-ribosylation factor family-domain-containing protein [Pavlovales sp. CCMP2436]
MADLPVLIAAKGAESAADAMAESHSPWVSVPQATVQPTVQPTVQLAAKGEERSSRPPRLMRNPRTWLAVVQILLHKFCCWWTIARPVDWRTVRVACLGIEGAGKTSVVGCIEGRPSIDQTSTPGFNRRSARVSPNWELDLWDLGGSGTIRPYWGRYLTSDTALVIFVVDSSDRARFGEARLALEKALRDLDDISLLVLANKQDCEGAANTHEIKEALLSSPGLLLAARSAVLPVSCARAAAEGDAAQGDASGFAAVLAWIATDLEAQWRGGDAV